MHSDSSPSQVVIVIFFGKNRKKKSSPPVPHLRFLFILSWENIPLARIYVHNYVRGILSYQKSPDLSFKEVKE
jgi:hypothetical protein